MRIKLFCRIVRAMFLYGLVIYMPDLARMLHPLVPDWSNHYQQPAFSIPPFWADWLFDSGSLTARLTALRPEGFSVQPLKQYYGQATPIEAAELQLKNEQKVWIREVILLLEQVPIVYARTAMPLSTLSGAEKQLKQLGKRSLGHYLFAQAQLQRGELHASRCRPNPLGLAWSRRSVFHLGTKKLIVSEAFTQQLHDFI